MENAERPEELRMETMGIIRKECVRLNRLLTNLLDFARPRNPEWIEIDVERLLESVIELVKHAAGKDIRFTTRTTQGMPPLLGDKEQIAQVILNLIINAAQAMPEGGEILLSASEKNGGVLIQVIDEGMGIPTEDMDKVSTHFLQRRSLARGLGFRWSIKLSASLGGCFPKRSSWDDVFASVPAVPGRPGMTGIVFSSWTTRRTSPRYAN